MRVWERWDKPEYFFRPGQLIKRLAYRHGISEVRLPNRLTLTVDSGDDMGRSMATRGVYDLVVSETIARLLEPGELAVDVGANVGYMTAIMAAQVGPSGRVVSFEPHPAIHPILTANAANWGHVAPVTVVNCAVSETRGLVSLHVPDGFDRNCGTASLKPIGAQVHAVEAVRLDDYFDPSVAIALLKIDVEGHEAAVLEGARRALASGSIRDVVFEDHGAYPGTSSGILESHGYRVFRLSRTFWKPLLLQPVNAGDSSHSLPLNYLATLDTGRAERLFRPTGWSVLRSGHGWNPKSSRDGEICRAK
jgi:FkbM family methyltransferase